ncbi:hypothetical protein F4679DRAFT_148532 [Xylaria curta]|nr:hypothetical protein F4679DRAFT_148532 [Xylaria curta]
MNYCAGAWTKDFPFFLLWSICDDGATTYNPRCYCASTLTDFKEPPLPGAPSWSLFSCPIIEGEVFNYIILGHFPVSQEASENFATSCVNVLSIHDTSHSYHDFAGLSLELNLPVDFIDIGEDNGETLRDQVASHLETIFKRWHNCAVEVHIDPRGATSLPHSVILGCVYETWPDISKWAGFHVAGLVMGPSNGQSDAWQRLGVWGVECPYADRDEGSSLRVDHTDNGRVGIIIGVEGPWEEGEANAKEGCCLMDWKFGWDRKDIHLT